MAITRPRAVPRPRPPCCYPPLLPSRSIIEHQLNSALHCKCTMRESSILWPLGRCRLCCKGECKSHSSAALGCQGREYTLALAGESMGKTMFTIQIQLYISRMHHGTRHCGCGICCQPLWTVCKQSENHRDHRVYSYLPMTVGILADHEWSRQQFKTRLRCSDGVRTNGVTA